MPLDRLRLETDPAFAYERLVEAVRDERAARKVGGDRLRQATARVTALIDPDPPAPDDPDTDEPA